MNNRVIAVSMQRVNYEEVYRNHPNSYTMNNPCGGSARAGKKVRRVLEAMVRKGKLYRGGVVDTKAHFQTIDTIDVLRRLYEQRRELLSKWREEGDVLLIGGEEFRDLMNHKDVLPMHFSFSIDGKIDHGGRTRTFQGMRVAVIPWMTGMVILPKGIV